jgi:hypothetical protein
MRSVTMLYWETADQDPSLDDAMLEWAAIWKPLGSRTRRDPHLQLESRLPPPPRGALAGSSADPQGEGWQRSGPTPRFSDPIMCR